MTDDDGQLLMSPRACLLPLPVIVDKGALTRCADVGATTRLGTVAFCQTVHASPQKTPLARGRSGRVKRGAPVRGYGAQCRGPAPRGSKTGSRDAEAVCLRASLAERVRRMGPGRRDGRRRGA